MSISAVVTSIITYTVVDLAVVADTVEAHLMAVADTAVVAVLLMEVADTAAAVHLMVEADTVVVVAATAVVVATGTINQH